MILKLECLTQLWRSEKPINRQSSAQSMEYAKLGNTGLTVSRICLGSNNFGTQLDEARSLSVIKKSLDLGINIIDTANTYTQGRSEEIIGKAVSGSRNDVVIATKVGFDLSSAPNQGGLSRKHISSQISASLRRLQTDYIDLYYMHRFDPATPLEESLRTLNELVKQGKVLYIGCSNFTAGQVAEANSICERLGLEKIVAVQPRYNLLARDPETELLPLCRKNNLAVLPYSPLMGGFLTGKYKRGSPPPAGTRGSSSERFWERTNNEENFAKLDPMMKISAEAGVQLSKLALAWLLRNPDVTAPVVGASDPAQVERTCEALNWAGLQPVLDRLERVQIASA